LKFTFLFLKLQDKHSKFKMESYITLLGENDDEWIFGNRIAQKKQLPQFIPLKQL